jgi:hypothetical protein
MRENYIHEAENLRNNLYHHIKRWLSRDVIGYEMSENGLRMTAVFFGRRILFVEYREDLGAHTRYIHTLKIIHR